MFSVYDRQRLENITSGEGFISQCHISKLRCLYSVDNFASVKLSTLSSPETFVTPSGIDDMMCC